GVICVNTSGDRPPKPCQSSAPRISTSQPSPNSVAATESTGDITTPLQRLAWRAVILCSPMASPDPPLDTQQHVARRGEHDEGDDEQDQAERDQGRRVEIADRLGEFVGDGGRDPGAGREQGGGDPMRVADDEGHRPRLAARAAEGEQYPA